MANASVKAEAEGPGVGVGDHRRHAAACVYSVASPGAAPQLWRDIKSGRSGFRLRLTSDDLFEFIIDSHSRTSGGATANPPTWCGGSSKPMFERSALMKLSPDALLDRR